MRPECTTAVARSVWQSGTHCNDKGRDETLAAERGLAGKKAGWEPNGCAFKKAVKKASRWSAHGAKWYGPGSGAG